MTPITEHAQSPRVIAAARVPAQAQTPARVPAARLPYEPWRVWYVPTAQTRPVTVGLALGSYFGAVLLTGGAAIALGVYRLDLTDAVGATLLAALTVGLQTLALAVVWGSRGVTAASSLVRRRVAGTMFAASALSAAGAAGILANGHAWFVGSALGVGVAVVGYLALPTVVGLVVGTGLSACLAVSSMGEVAEPTPVSVGLALVALGSALALMSIRGLVKHRWAGLGLGACVALVGAQQPLAGEGSAGWAYLLTLTVGCACLALYRRAPAPVLLGVGIVGTAIVALEATWDHATGAGGVAATLAVTGAAMLAASTAGMYMWRTRLRRR